MPSVFRFASLVFSISLTLAVISSAKADPGQAKDFQGVIKLLGSSLNQRSFLQTDQGPIYPICRAAGASFFKTIRGFKVDLQGTLQKPERARRCLSPSHLRLKQAPDGQTPFVGQLTQVESRWYFETADQTKYTLRQKPAKVPTQKKILVQLRSATAQTEYDIKNWVEIPETPFVIEAVPNKETKK
jgi:hypothetical protein